MIVFQEIEKPIINETPSKIIYCAVKITNENKIGATLKL
jgi:hypothetical protein